MVFGHLAVNPGVDGFAAVMRLLSTPVCPCSTVATRRALSWALLTQLAAAYEAYDVMHVVPGCCAYTGTAHLGSQQKGFC
jgi:hypothetical protein